MGKRSVIKVICLVGALALLSIWLSGIVGGKPLTYRPMKAGDEALSREDIEYQDVEAPAPSSSDGTVTAEDWAEIYPYITATMGKMSENEFTVDYLEESPYLVNIYEGYGFAKDYKSARGHTYTLEDVAATERPHALANCLTCKTPNFTKLVNDQGVSVYSMDFEEVYKMMEETVSCYTCHGNNAGSAGELTVTHSYVTKALGEEHDGINPSVLSCGQCHIEYYFDPETKEASMPYHSSAEMTPAAILAYYDSMGYSDWTQESTGAKLLKAQHPEMETFLAGKHAAVLNCADCHMPLVQEQDGTVYHSHNFVSPLEDESLLASCAQCHGDRDMADYVHQIQTEITERETEVGTKLSELKDALSGTVADGKMDDEQLERVRKLYRDAQWYFDYCYVENSEGAHNSALAKECLNTSESKIAEAMALLQV